MAEQLYIIAKTASNHAVNVLSQLGTTNQRDAAAITVRHALV